MDHSAVIDVVREVNGPNARLDHSYGIHMAPGTSGLWVHGGGTPFDPAQYYEVRQGRIHCGLIGVHGPWPSILPVVADSAASLARTRPTSYVHRQLTTGIHSSTKWRCRRATW